MNGITRISFTTFKPGTFSQTLNTLLSATGDKYFAIVPPGIDFLPGSQTRIFDQFKKSGKIAMVYSDYILKDGINETAVVLSDYNGDFTERFDFGAVQIYRTDIIRQLGGFATQYRYHLPITYDLRLRLSERKFKFIHIAIPLYRIYQTSQQQDAKLFSAFKYLQYDKKEEAEIENVFYTYLKRQSAYLTHRPQRVVYRSGEKFSPLVSIVSPTYNRVKWVAKAIESVLNQTFTDWELIFVDNCSTDGTAEIIKEYSVKDQRIKLIANKKYQPGAIARCLNQGISSAKGKYYAQLDSDDEYVPDTLKEMVNYLESHPTVGLAISYYILIDESSRVIKQIPVVKHLEFNRNNILRCEGAGAVRVWHKKVWSEFGGFNETLFGEFGEDYDLVLKTCEKYDVGRVHQILYKYRRHSEVTDVLRNPKLKMRNKTLARLMAVTRRRKFNLPK